MLLLAPVQASAVYESPSEDWLVARPVEAASARLDPERHELVLENGLLRRVVRTMPDAATVAFDDLRTGASLLRAVRPEARLTVDGRDVAVGGLAGQVDQAWLDPRWVGELIPLPDEDALHLALVEPREIEPVCAWQRVRHAPDVPWPAQGAGAALVFRAAPGAPEPLASLEVTVRYEVYDGLPVLGKWIEVANLGVDELTIDAFRSELLAATEVESRVESPVEPSGWRVPGIQVLSDFSFGESIPGTGSRAARWVPDRGYTTQVNYALEAPVQLECGPLVGPGVTLAPGGRWTSFRVWELVHDATDRERRGLAVRRFHRRLAPWSGENPLMLHVRDARDEVVREALEQCAEVGFEMAILSFGSGFDLEDRSPETLARWRELADFAHERGVELGGYSLFSSRSIGPETDVVDRATGQPGGARFGSAPCLASDWGTRYLATLRGFFEATGFDLLEHDGPYPGDTCASSAHSAHAGWEDSQWAQWTRSRDLYRDLRARGVYVNAPDDCFLCGASKTAMGYRETNWSLPRELQPVHARQNLFDGTWEKTPSMGWMFVPLTEYHGGGAAATIEPLREHLEAYEAHLAATLGYGAQACWRGPRLYDAPETRDLVRRWVDWFLAHRRVLESDVIHLRRADGRDLDYVLHVDPAGEERALLAVWNPLDVEVRRRLRVPVWYAGLEREARVETSWGTDERLEVSRAWTVELDVVVPATGFAWAVLRGE